IASPTAGCRAWLAISGGVDVPLILNSRSGDLRAGFGGVRGRPVRDGEDFPLGRNSDASKSLVEKLRGNTIANWKPPHEWSNTCRKDPSLRFVRGVNQKQFVSSALERFTSKPFFVSPDSDRMGIRLNGPELERREDVDLLSEAVAPGTVQVPPNGQPILLLNDCQTIGGYPKIAHVAGVDLSIAAQLCPGDRVRFAEVSLNEAQAQLLQRARHLEQFRRGLEARFN